jgi:hypothetical protein
LLLVNQQENGPGVTMSTGLRRRSVRPPAAVRTTKLAPASSMAESAVGPTAMAVSELVIPAGPARRHGRTRAGPPL